MIGPRFGLGGIDDSGGNATCEELASLAIGMGLRRIRDGRVAGSRRPGGRRIRAALPQDRITLGRGRSRRLLPHLGGAGSADRGRAIGYRSVRRNGRYSVFPVVAWEGIHAAGKADAVVEIWNGMPFFSPFWFHGPSVVFLHHVHAEMWRMALPPSLAALGRRTESTIAPLLYRRSRIVTLSRSSPDEIVSMLGIPEHRVTVVPRGSIPASHPAASAPRCPSWSRWVVWCP